MPDSRGGLPPEDASRWRRVPLKAAGAIGVVVSLVYLAGVLGQDDATFLPQALFWFAVMAIAGVAAWLADRFPQHGRVMAIAAGVAFFVVALFSNVIFTVAFLIAAALIVIGLAMMRPA